jgi:two-component system, OmpR family, alkaline phosphatase synthesis response regulator PhoP
MKKMSSKNKILLVEDEESLALGLEFNLSVEGYEVTWARDGKQAIDKFDSDDFDLVVLDIMLPYMDGFQVADKIRYKNPQIPVLILTARTEIKDIIKGLEVGADDYLTKPFHLEEFLLRIRGMIKRKQWYRGLTRSSAVARFGENEVNFETLEASASGIKFRLTLHEAMLLRYLTEQEGQIVTRKELLEEVWNISSEIETRTVDNFIARLRKYFEPDPNKPQHFKSIRGVGYKFEKGV